MKKYILFPAFIIVSFFVILNAGCNGRNVGRDTLANLDNCLRNCDERERACRDKLIECLKTCDDRIEVCIKTNPPGSDELYSCIGKVISECQRTNCLNEYRACMEEIDRCRQECRTKYPLPTKEN